MLIHEVPQQFRRARATSRPLALLKGGNQTSLRLKAGDIGRIFRAPQSINKGARTRKLRIAVDQDQGRIHHIVLQLTSITISPACATGVGLKEAKDYIEDVMRRDI